MPDDSMITKVRDRVTQLAQQLSTTLGHQQKSQPQTSSASSPSTPSTPQTTMDPNLASLLQKMRDRSGRVKDPRNHPWQTGEPYHQPYFTYSDADGRWRAIVPSYTSHSSSTTATTTTAGESNALEISINDEKVKSNVTTTLTIMSWNIDFMSPLATPRMRAAINHLRTHLTSPPPSSTSNFPPHPTPHHTSPSSKTAIHHPIILLQEMLSSDLLLLQSTPWIQEFYNMTDVSPTYWESRHYGTCTLIPKTLAINGVFRVHYEDTRMERDGLFVDIDINIDTSSEDFDRHVPTSLLPSDTSVPISSSTSTLQSQSPSASTKKIVRICNTHLESLIATPPLRPSQMRTASKYMHAPEIHAAVLGGDLNAIQDFDEKLHTDNELRDAYLECHGTTSGNDRQKSGDDGDGDDNDGGGVSGRGESKVVNTGWTWGQMARPTERQKYGCSRMDKLFYCGGVELARPNNHDGPREIEIEESGDDESRKKIKKKSGEERSEEDSKKSRRKTTITKTRKSFETFGLGVEVDDPLDRTRLMEMGQLEGGWVTDHLGVKGRFVVV